MKPAYAEQSSESDGDVVARVIAGERSAFAILVRRHNQRLYRACRAIVRDDTEAEDATQAAWIKAYRHLASFRGDSAFTTWITRIAIREAQDRMKKVRPLAAIEDIVDEPQQRPDAATFAAELGRLFERRLDELPAGLRSVLLLRDVLELDTKETAESLEISEEAVRVRLHRARQALADMIDVGLVNAWKFAGERCDRITHAVMESLLS